MGKIKDLKGKKTSALGKGARNNRAGGQAGGRAVSGHNVNVLYEDTPGSH